MTAGLNLLLLRNGFACFIYLALFAQNSNCGLTEPQKDTLWAIHNNLRQFTAAGNLTIKGTQLGPAAEMNLLNWSNKLERLAKSYAQNCKWIFSDHENANVTHGITMFYTRKLNSFNDLLTSWKIALSKHAPGSLTRYEPNHKWSRLTQSIWSTVTAFGCARQSYCEATDKTGRKHKWQLLVCVFNVRGNIPDKPVYHSGQPCVKCECGNTKHWPSLCTGPLVRNATLGRKNNTVIKRKQSDSNVVDKAGLSTVEKQYILNRHNDEREMVAKGLRYNRGRRMPSAANMFALQWDDQLEQDARAWIRQCLMQHDPKLPSTDQNENLSFYGKRNIRELVAMWIDERFEFDLVEGVTQFTARDLKNGIGHFTQLIWATTTQIGCAIAKCPGDRYHLGCRYAPRGNYYSDSIYQVGAPCSQCAQYGGYCEPISKLCIPWKIQAHPTVELWLSTAGKQRNLTNPTANRTFIRTYVFMSRDGSLRAQMLAAHNNERRRVAVGMQMAGFRHWLRTAADMMILTWDRNLADLAQQQVNRCQLIFIRNESIGEIILTGDAGTSASELLQTAIMHGRQQRLGTVIEMYPGRQTTRVSDYTQILWAKTERVGCGYHSTCQFGSQKRKAALICYYTERGNQRGRQVYQIGAPCSECRKAKLTECDERYGMCRRISDD